MSDAKPLTDAESKLKAYAKSNHVFLLSVEDIDEIERDDASDPECDWGRAIATIRAYQSTLAVERQESLDTIAERDEKIAEMVKHINHLGDAIPFPYQEVPELTVNRAIFRMKELRADSERLRDLLHRLLSKLSHERIDYSGVGWCAGCRAVLYCTGDDQPRDPCKPDCVLQEALREVKKGTADE